VFIQKGDSAMSEDNSQEKNQEPKSQAQIMSERMASYRSLVIKLIAKQAVDGKIIPSTEVIKSVGIPALMELLALEADDAEGQWPEWKAMTALSLWRSCFAVNDSAFWQGVERDIDNKLITSFVVSRKPTLKARAQAIASEYNGMV
jgi:hypothetical protein